MKSSGSAIRYYEMDGSFFRITPLFFGGEEAERYVRGKGFVRADISELWRHGRPVSKAAFVRALSQQTVNA